MNDDINAAIDQLSSGPDLSSSDAEALDVVLDAARRYANLPEPIITFGDTGDPDIIVSMLDSPAVNAYAIDLYHGDGPRAQQRRAQLVDVNASEGLTFRDWLDEEGNELAEDERVPWTEITRIHIL